MQLLSDGIETTAIFSCNLGYSMEGYARSVCRADGSWDISAPTCGEDLLYVTILSRRKHSTDESCLNMTQCDVLLKQ